MSSTNVPPEFVEAGRKLKRTLKNLSMPVTWLMLAGALTLVLSAVPLAFLLNDATTPAFIRTASLLPTGFFAFSLVSMYVKPLYTYQWILLVSGIISLIVLFLSWLFEFKRWSRCNGVSSTNVTSVENEICVDYPRQVWIAPTLITVVFFVSAVSFIYVLFVANSVTYIKKKLVRLFNKEKKERASIIYRAADNPANVQVELLEYAESKEPTEAEKANGPPRVQVDWVDYVQVVANALLTGGLLFVSITAMATLNSAAFYRASFLMPAAMLAGSHITMWRTPVRYWRWIVAAFAALTVFAAIWGMTVEFGRYANCLADPKTPFTTTEAFICDEEGWLVGVVPFTLLGAALAGVINLAMVIARLVVGAPA
jgi:hypothetical protein